MKKIFNFMLVLGGMLVLAASCNKILEEHPKTIFTPGYFSTPAGVEGGLTALYSHPRSRTVASGATTSPPAPM